MQSHFDCSLRPAISRQKKKKLKLICTKIAYCDSNAYKISSSLPKSDSCFPLPFFLPNTKKHLWRLCLQFSKMDAWIITLVLLATTLVNSSHQWTNHGSILFLSEGESTVLKAPGDSSLGCKWILFFTHSDTLIQSHLIQSKTNQSLRGKKLFRKTKWVVSFYFIFKFVSSSMKGFNL